MKRLNHICRAANNGWSTDNVWSELGIDRTNLSMAGHVVWSLTDLLREILVFNYLIIMRGSIHVSEGKKTNIKLGKLVVKKFPVVAISTMSSSPVVTSNHRVFRYFIYFKSSQLVEAFTFG